MAARALSLKPTNLPVTVRTLPSGVPYAHNINFVARSGVSHGGHDEHGKIGPRKDVPPSWASGLRMGGTAFESRMRVMAPSTPYLRLRHLHTTAPPAIDAPSPYAVPDYSHYRAQSDTTNRALSYFMVGSLGLLAASAGKATITDFLASMAASADVLALAKVEVAMENIPEGKNVIIKWRGKPVFIRHRTPDEIEEARSVDVKTLRDPQTDEQRTKKPEWLVMLGVCTHLGCVPIGESGDFGGWFCPCHGSHYDISGRARKGPAPLNLEVPAYEFNEGEGKIVIG